MFRFIFIVAITTTLSNFSLFAQTKSNIDYIHKKNASFQSKLVIAGLKIIGSKKSKKSINKNYLTKESPGSKIRNNFDLEVTELNGRKIYHISPKKHKRGQTIIYFHGGAYTANFLKPHWQLIRKLVNKTGSSVIAADYPLAPEFQYEDNIEFVLSMYREVLKNHPSDSLILMGDSAGGGLALVLGQIIRDQKLAPPSQIIMFAPWLDISMSNPDISSLDKKDPMLNVQSVKKSALAYAGNENKLQDPKLSPIFGNVGGLNNLSLFVGGRDVLVSDCHKFKQMCSEKNQNLNFFYYPKMFHVWMAVNFLPESKKTLNQVADLMR